MSEVDQLERDEEWIVLCCAGSGEERNRGLTPRCNDACPTIVNLLVVRRYRYLRVLLFMIKASKRDHEIPPDHPEGSFVSWTYSEIIETGMLVSAGNVSRSQSQSTRRYKC